MKFKMKAWEDLEVFEGLQVVALVQKTLLALYHTPLNSTHAVASDFIKWFFSEDNKNKQETLYFGLLHMVSEKQDLKVVCRLFKDSLGIPLRVEDATMEVVDVILRDFVDFVIEFSLLKNFFRS